MKVILYVFLLFFIVSISKGNEECKDWLNKIVDKSIDLYCTSLSLVGIENKNMISLKGNMNYIKRIDALQQSDKFLYKLSEESVTCEPSLRTNQPFSIKSTEKISGLTLFRNFTVSFNSENFELFCDTDNSFYFKTPTGRYLMEITQTKSCKDNYFISPCNGNTKNEPIKRSERLTVGVALVDKWNETEKLYQYEGILINDNDFPVADVQVSSKNFIPLSVWGLDMNKDLLRLPNYKDILKPGESFTFGFVIDNQNFSLDVYNYQSLE